jgi:hypothetical protein
LPRVYQFGRKNQSKNEGAPFSSLGNWLWRDTKGQSVLSNIIGLIGGKDLKFCLIDSSGDGRFPLELAWTSGIDQYKFF